MGVFISRTVSPTTVENSLRDAYMEPPLDEATAETRAATEAPEIAKSAAAGTTKFHAGRFLAALAIFGILLTLAILAEANEWVADPTRIYDFAATVLGVIVGFLGGEAVGSSTT